MLSVKNARKSVTANSMASFNFRAVLAEWSRQPIHKISLPDGNR